MITPMQMYWLVKLDDIRRFFDGMFALPCAVALAGLVGSVTCTLMYLFAGNGSYELFEGKSDEQFKDIRSLLLTWRKRLLTITLVAVGVAMAISGLYHFTPTTKQMAAVVVVPKIANSEKVQMAGNKLYELAVEWMDELRPRKAGAPAPATPAAPAEDKAK